MYNVHIIHIAELVQKFIKFLKIKLLYLSVSVIINCFLSFEMNICDVFVYFHFCFYIDFGLSSISPNRYLYWCAIFTRSLTQPEMQKCQPMPTNDECSDEVELIFVLSNKSLLSKFKSCVQSELCAIKQIGKK